MPNEITNYNPKQLPPQGEVLKRVPEGKLQKASDEVIKNLKNLSETEAGREALELDKKDGKIDGKISASIWNEYAESKGGKTVVNEISVIDAMNSITTYNIREASEKAKAEKSDLESKSPQAPDMGV